MPIHLVGLPAVGELVNVAVAAAALFVKVVLLRLKKVALDEKMLAPEIMLLATARPPEETSPAAILVVASKVELDVTNAVVILPPVTLRILFEFESLMKKVFVAEPRL